MQTFNLQARGPLQCLATARPRSGAPHPRRQPSFHTRASTAVAENGAALQNGVSFQVRDVFPPAEPEPVSPEVQAIIDEQGLDYETSGLQYLTNEARVSQLSESFWQNLTKRRGWLVFLLAEVCVPGHCQHSKRRAAVLCAQECVSLNMVSHYLQHSAKHIWLLLLSSPSDHKRVHLQ